MIRVTASSHDYTLLLNGWPWNPLLQIPIGCLLVRTTCCATVWTVRSMPLQVATLFIPSGATAAQRVSPEPIAGAFVSAKLGSDGTSCRLFVAR